MDKKISCISGLAFICAGLAWAQAPQRLPSTNLPSLAGSRVTLPAASRGRVAVLVIGFTQGSSDPTSQWAAKLATVPKSLPVTQFAVAVLEDAPAFFRPIIETGMRHGLSKSDQRNFLILNHGETLWKKLVGFRYSQSDAAYILLLGRHGHIRGHWMGLPNAVNWSGFLAALRRVEARR